jgi:hypothetical protein
VRLWWYLFRGWAALAAGSVVCWWKDGHAASWQAGVLPAITWGGVSLPRDTALNPDPAPPSNLYWERTYCTRCGVTLKEGTP